MTRQRRDYDVTLDPLTEPVESIFVHSSWLFDWNFVTSISDIYKKHEIP